MPNTPDNYPKGRIRTDVYVSCGCGNHEYLDWLAAKKAGGNAALAKAMGWKRTRDRGWMCPHCIERYRKDA